MSDKLKALGTVLLGIVGFVAFLIVIPITFFLGAAWVSAKVFPLLIPAVFWTLAASVLACAAGALFRFARGVASIVLLFCSFVFGFVLWVWSFIVTYALWGVFGVVFGLFFAGIGIVPVAFLAILFHAKWSSLWDFLFMIAATLGSRLLAFWFASKAEAESFG